MKIRLVDIYFSYDENGKLESVNIVMKGSVAKFTMRWSKGQLSIHIDHGKLFQDELEDVLHIMKNFHKFIKDNTIGKLLGEYTA